MSSELKLDQEERDILAEIMNIAFGRASADLAEVIDIYVALSIPYVEIHPGSDLPSYIQEEVKDFENISVIKQNFWGEFKGIGLLIFSSDAGKKLISLMQDSEESRYYEENAIDVLEKETLMEIGNILIGACIGKVVDLLGDLVTYSPPQVLTSNANNEENISKFIDTNSSAIVMRTLFHFNEQNVSGHLFLLTSDESIQWLKQALANFMKQYE